MIANLLLSVAVGLAQAPPVEVAIATVPPDTRVDLTLSPSGKVEIRREETLSRVKVQIDQIAPLTVDPDLRSWVVWAVSPEGDFQNLGELESDGRKAELETVTPYSRLGILITAEPHFLVDSPSAPVAFTSSTANKSETRVDRLSVDVGVREGSLSLPPQGNIHPHVTEARIAVAIAESEASGPRSTARLRQARVSLESLEQMLRREAPLNVLLPYANDAIRLADMTVREAREEAAEDRLRQLDDRVRSLEQSLDRTRVDLERTEANEQASETRASQLLEEVEQVRNTTRSLTLERDGLSRELDQAKSQIKSLEDPWPPLRMALVFGFGARETPRGLVMTLPPTAFEEDGLRPETREWLSRLGGTLGFTEFPEVWIEGHSLQEQAQEVSERRAQAVGDYLIETGLPEARIQARGLGDLAPIPGAEEAGAADLNERVEIIVRQPGTL